MRKKVIALGYFDGVHLGHQQVISETIRLAGVQLVPAVFTFQFDGDAYKKKRNDITTFYQKEAVLRRMGIQDIFAPDFSSFCNLTGEQFVQEILLDQLHGSAVCCGENFRFGKNAGWGSEQLLDICNENGILCEIVKPFFDQEQWVSSTRIRTALEAGDCMAANRLLGRAFSLCMPVIHGKGLGRTLQFPTINQQLPEGIVKPKNGVYATIVQVGEKRYSAVTNIGLRPTVEDTDVPRLETHLFGFDGDLYGAHVSVGFLEYLRCEKKFAGKNFLQKQIAADMQKALVIANSALQNNLEML